MICLVDALFLALCCVVVCRGRRELSPRVFGDDRQCLVPLPLGLVPGWAGPSCGGVSTCASTPWIGAMTYLEDGQKQQCISCATMALGVCRLRPSSVCITGGGSR
ncbi:hypothetical protein B0T11DRAFT_271956 [Plectosphaerella cucumerina]|uniref:Secreted protein n=1 Tax=Plectosphaerella cucumerina TaxID=40658 RepID=A0A8K0TUE3_9PEZI|nr:hypothetical protein B0T11DRAFT_271956 [Plectosphaerella cucumerina]